VTSRQFTVIALLATVVSVVLLVTVLRSPEGDGSVVSQPLQSSPTEDVASAATPPRNEIASRLREILRIREEAYRLRSVEMLESIYSRDCPCMASDEQAIEELLDRGYVWDDISSSVEIRSESRVNKRVWIVVARFRSERLSIKTEQGRLVRTESAGSDLFEFTLVKPGDAHSWLLGVASVIEGG
jgi:hypothetical protein